MKTIHKFMLARGDSPQAITLPLGAKILCVQMQGEALMMWAEVSPDEQPEVRVFEIFGTGWPIEAPGFYREYIGTAQTRGGLVWHVYERTALPVT